MDVAVVLRKYPGRSRSDVDSMDVDVVVWASVLLSLKSSRMAERSSSSSSRVGVPKGVACVGVEGGDAEEVVLCSFAP